LASSTTKKVCIRCANLQLLTGYVSPPTFQRREGIELLDRNAQARLLPYDDVRAVYFVRDFEDNPEANQKTAFASRPKSDGLWIRMRFRDEETLEGLLPNDLLQVSDLGFMMTPPDPNANIQKIFVPRAALDAIQVLGVIGSAVHRRRSRRKEPSKEQMDLFQKLQEPE
jgi:Family of unknown function (DUF6982)